MVQKYIFLNSKYTIINLFYHGTLLLVSILQHFWPIRPMPIAHERSFLGARLNTAQLDRAVLHFHATFPSYHHTTLAIAKLP